MELVFDGHNDVLLRLWHTMHKGGDPVAEFVNGTTAGHIDGPRAKKGGLAGGISAIYIPSGDFEIKAPAENGHYEMPLTAPLERAPSLDIALEFASIALKLERAGAWRLLAEFLPALRRAAARRAAGGDVVSPCGRRGGAPILPAT